MKDLEHIGSRAFYRPGGQVNIEQGVEMVAAAIRAARNLGLADILVDITKLTGFGIPSVFERYKTVTAWVAAAGSQFGVAVVIRPEIMDPQKIGTLMAQNRNAIGDVFTSEAEAVAWLDAQSVRFRRTGNPRHEGNE